MIGEGGDLVYISKTWLWLLNGERRRSGSRSGSEREARMRVGAPIPPPDRTGGGRSGVC